MSQTQSHLSKLFKDAFRQLEPKRTVPEIEVKFYPYARLNNTIRIRSGRVYVRISNILEKAPIDVQRALAFILVARLRSRRPPDVHERVYRDYAYSPEIVRASERARQLHGLKISSSARGRFYNLDKMFTKLNQDYFGGRLEKPTLTWSQRRTRRILGHHNDVHGTIVISKALDDSDVPGWFVEYILYHEMLHIKHPARWINGRLYHHTNAFRAEEQRFPNYEAAQKWLDDEAHQNRTARARAA